MHVTIDEKNYFATVDTLWLAMQGECNTRRILVDYPEIQGAADYFLRVELPDMTVYDMQIVNNQVILSNAVTQFSGIVKLQWIAKDGTGSMIAKSQVVNVIVKDSIDGDTSAIPTPSVPETSVGFSMPLNFSIENAPENPPRFVSTSGLIVFATCSFINSTDL